MNRRSGQATLCLGGRVRALGICGHVHDDFRPVAHQLEKQLGRAGVGGAAVCVYHRGERVVDAWAGTRNPSGDPWQADTLAMSFSTTKGVLATLVLALVDRGLLDYDDPVARHWPEFAQAGKERVTLRQLLSHQAGLHRIRSLIDDAERILDWNYMVTALAAAAPACDPGSRPCYHGLTFGWLVGEVVRRVTGTSVAEALRTFLAEPLGLDGAFIGAPTSVRGRVATLLVPEDDRAGSRRFRISSSIVRALAAMVGIDVSLAREVLSPSGFRAVCFSDRLLDAEVPALNGVFTARSLARMYAVLAGGGELEGRRFLSPASIRRAAEVQSRKLDAVVGFPMRWRLGYHVVGTSRGILSDAFGHFGYGGSGAWADPDRQLAVAMTLNRIAGTPFADMRMATIGGVAAHCAGRRRRRSS